jgi:Zn-dependent protease
MTTGAWLERQACAACGTQLAPGRLVCPSCHTLVHAEALKARAQRAEQATRDGDPREALAAWREALALLPPESVQSKRVGETVAALAREVEALPMAPPAPSDTSTDVSGRRGWWAGLGGLGVLLWKFKLAVLFVLGKLKLLLFGLGKLSTLLSMLASVGVYWAMWGWPFAFGLVGCIYIHEIGHVAALQRLGIKASAPMFVPGLGAFVRLKEYPATPRDDAYVGLAGPIWGMGAAIACFAVWYWSRYDFWAALAEWGARINLFNLIPFASLDGGRGFRALSRVGRAAVLAATLVGVSIAGDPALWLILVAGGLRLIGERDAPRENDARALGQFLVLVVVLSVLCVAPIWMGAHTPAR